MCRTEADEGRKESKKVSLSRDLPKRKTAAIAARTVTVTAVSRSCRPSKGLSSVPATTTVAFLSLSLSFEFQLELSRSVQHNIEEGRGPSLAPQSLPWRTYRSATETHGQYREAGERKSTIIVIRKKEPKYWTEIATTTTKNSFSWQVSVSCLFVCLPAEQQLLTQLHLKQFNLKAL